MKENYKNLSELIDHINDLADSEIRTVFVAGINNFKELKNKSIEADGKTDINTSIWASKDSCNNDQLTIATLKEGREIHYTLSVGYMSTSSTANMRLHNREYK